MSLALLLPVIGLYACEYLRGDGRAFTGFIQYDQPYYMADAREFFDGGFHLLYGNPFSPDPHTPQIYFQIHLFVLGLAEAATGCDPGALYVVFGFFAALVCARVAMALYEEVAGLGTRAEWAGLVLFVWGGGVLALTGLGFHLVEGSGVRTTVTDLFHFDPMQGWWFPNLGRNLVYPTEAWYHALALGAVVMAMRNHFRGALWLAFLLSLSHPFTGLQFLLILLGWCGLERGFMGNRAIPLKFPAMLVVLLVFHVGYNVFLLDLFPEHRVVFLQWAHDWPDPASAFVPADILVGFFAWRAMRNRGFAAELFSIAANRLLLCWFVVSFALAHHDLVTKAWQPLHFTHGYTWIPLFLLGAQPLLRMLERSFSLKRTVLRVAAVGSIFVIGLSDNAAWFGLHAAMAVAPRLGITWLSEDGFRLSGADRELYGWLMKRPGPHEELLVAPDSDSRLVYLAMAYTDYRGWYSHYDVTPFANERRGEMADFFQTGAVPSGWRGRTILVIVPKGEGDDYRGGAGPAVVYENEGYRVRMMEVR
ncbi:MAG TPA: hypothetical protein VGZ93_09290 [Candidatus Methylacidiphilales bacterium]|nr:hypothetical protein [Candidatus Methylacidiphilales bacterium]